MYILKVFKRKQFTKIFFGKKLGLSKATSGQACLIYQFQWYSLILSTHMKVEMHRN